MNVIRSIPLQSCPNLNQSACFRSLYIPLLRPSAGTLSFASKRLDLKHSMHSSAVPRTQQPRDMRCILIKDGKGPADNLYMGEEPTPRPDENEVLVKVRSLRMSVHVRSNHRSPDSCVRSKLSD